MTQLRVCDGCSRHVFATEKACPFCSAPLEEAPKRTFGERLRKGMSRAQLLAVAAAVTGQTLGACTDTPNEGTGHYTGGSSGTTAGTDPGTGGSSNGTGGSGGTVSGGAGGAGAGGTTGGAGATGGSGGEVGQPVYGAPIPDDAGADASVEPDAAVSEDGGIMVIPLYGASPEPR